MASKQVSEKEARQVAEAAREAEWKLPSFGKELFLGNFRLDLIHPQPKLSAEATEKGDRFLAELRTFLENKVDPLQIERDAKIPGDVVEGLKEMGALGMKIPTEYGGLGLSQVYYNKALALAGVWHSSLSTLLSAHQSIGLPQPLMLFGSDEQKKEWLPKVARTHISAFLLTEPDVGSDPARLSATAVPSDDGTSYVSQTKYGLKIAREWGNERVQWGVPVGKHDAVAQKTAFLAGTAFGLEAMLDVSSRLADEKRNDIRIEAALAKLYGSEMGWKAMDELVQIRGGRGYETAESLKARGEKPVPVEQALRDMRINRIFEGSTEIMHLFIAREAGAQHRSVAGDILDPETDLKAKVASAREAAAFYSKWLPGLVTGEGQKPGSFAEFGSLAGHLRFVERSSRKLARTTFMAMGRYQAGLEKKQAVLGRIVDIGAELFAIASAVVYANTIKGEHPDRADQAFELADLFAKQARRRVDELFTAVVANAADA